MLRMFVLMAQLVTNPNFLQFDSPDHYAVSVYTYHVDFTQVGAQAPFTGFDVAAGAVTILDPTVVRLEINLTTQAQGALVALPLGVQFTASVLATSQGGTSPRSTSSNPFERAPSTPRAALNVIAVRR
jgi:hypothetical protein